MQNTTYNPKLSALRLHEEEMCRRYLLARKDMGYQASYTASLVLLAKQHPSRVDYRKAANLASEQYTEAVNRAHRAYEIYQAAARRADSEWAAPQVGAA
ncbi:hypothetical protein M8C13_36320 [Crossiella sp. SN42]|uniref:hypothetical protein n=1 Tax=Crossiella sp. SN42 TaxID=2944808 RepID=UPI00207D3D1C|nr:hypothetical protein [Crossiella sp. SN42]MCO1581230.1 hypothetical protein [Crossiella sp. SN42]